MKYKYKEVECKKGIEPLLYIRMPSKFQHFEHQDIVSFNTLCIKTKELAFLCKKDETIYMCIFDLPRKRVNKEKFIEESEKLYRLCLRRYREKK